jgi:UDP-N-acetylglucosamine/UDP-N-acetylgalactosamine diphosphorylase
MKDKLHAHLSPHGQEHLLAFWDELDEADRRALADQIGSVDFGLIDRLYRAAHCAENWAELASRAEAPPALRLNDPHNRFSPAEARRRGDEALAAGQLGVILVAGGQGTRLGFDHPKGMYPIGPVSRATLFQILLEKIVARARQHGVRIPLYLMTSPATHAETVQYLKANDYFGLAAQDVNIFCQGTMPAVHAQTGRLLLADKANLFLSPDGHGGLLAALAASGGLDEMRRRDIRQLFYLQVDNPLVVMCDPEFVGYHLLSQSEISTQVVRKRRSRDKVGNVVMVDGRMRIIEYSDLNPLGDEIVERLGSDGTPIFWAGNTAVHVIETAFLERAARSDTALPFHVARKAVPHVDSTGRPVVPDEPNAIKFERFIFDLLPEARIGIVMEVDEQRIFAPVKNGPGERRDSPETVRAQMIALHRQWLEAAGCRVQPGVAVEISPLFAQDAEETAARVEPGLAVTRPRCFC